MQKNFKGFARAEVKILQGIAESGIGNYIEKAEIKSKIKYDINSFLDINFKKLTLLTTDLQHKMDLLPINQKEQWEKHLKQTLSDHLLKEDLIEQLQKLQNTIQASHGSDHLCPNAIQ